MALGQVSLALILVIGSINQINGYIMSCYLENWGQFREGNANLSTSDVDPHLCTHINIAFANVTYALTLAPSEETDLTGLYPEVVALKHENPSLKVLIAVGGWTHGSETFANMVETKENRSLFIDNAISYLRLYKFDGIDLDWEYPAARGSPPEDKERFALLCQELRDAFELEARQTGKCRLLLTAAVPAGFSTINNGYDVPALDRSLDFVNLMAYDLHGSWENKTGHNAPLTGEPEDKFTVTFAANYWKTLGMSPEKIIVGLPAYGQYWTTDSPTGPAGTPAGKPSGQMFYHDICGNSTLLANKQLDRIHQVPYTYSGDLWLSFDDKDAYIRKCNFIKENGFGGGMVWSIGVDDFNGKNCGEKFPLHSTISNCLGIRNGTNPLPSTVDQFGCPTRSGYFIDPCDCSKFYHCDHFIAHQISCPATLRWNQDHLTCDWPSNVTCPYM